MHKAFQVPLTTAYVCTHRTRVAEKQTGRQRSRRGVRRANRGGRRADGEAEEQTGRWRSRQERQKSGRGGRGADMGGRGADGVRGAREASEEQTGRQRSRQGRQMKGHKGPDRTVEGGLDSRVWQWAILWTGAAGGQTDDRSRTVQRRKHTGRRAAGRRGR